MNSYQQMYTDINDKFGEIIKKSLFERNGEKHAKIASFFDDYSKWEEIIEGNNETIIFSEAKSEYRTMLLFLCMGLYKNAYMSLRGYFELTMFGIKISTSDLDFRLWKKGEKDVHWSEITDKEQGIFSSKYISVYNNDLDEDRDEMRQESIELYRVCSEHIHSGYTVTVKNIEVDFDQETFSKICDEVSRINRIITYSLCIRYGDVLKEHEKRDELEESILEQLPDIQAVHRFLQ